MEGRAGIYDKLWDESYSRLKTGSVETDHYIDSPEDKRYGITLLTRPDVMVRQKISIFLEKLCDIEPRQYYYPNSDLHMTVLSVISCFDGFHLRQVDPTAYQKVIQRSLENIGSFEIHFCGVTASPSAVLIQGFPTDSTLEVLREVLRDSFRSSELMATIDSRYRIQTAHMTVVRFRDELLNPDAFLNLLQEYRHYDFGKMKVDRLELVFNDWYQRRSTTRRLAEFRIGV